YRGASLRIAGRAAARRLSHLLLRSTPALTGAAAGRNQKRGQQGPDQPLLHWHNSASLKPRRPAFFAVRSPDNPAREECDTDFPPANQDQIVDSSPRLLVPKLCLGTHVLEALLPLGPSPTRSRASYPLRSQAELGNEGNPSPPLAPRCRQ